ncbi:uncharacterized protein I206_102199 [Kwoniella pini CBS 10737]|uniref:Uncharacterized protein n=1 Tax=Kwoniella pini CBS 10737 TaxID=1296096 RepID=A0A1B9HUJ0_9TREE|nr:uncharacterized protein I206_06708 [Kwoniella pini CBS 10737]OCF46934.1 hypothetical protein I206_06708 [Kwoniella pini CBS 10737]
MELDYQVTDTAPGPPVGVESKLIPPVHPSRRISSKDLPSKTLSPVDTSRTSAQEYQDEIERELKAKRLVKGIDNDDLNALLRMFDKHVQNVHICPHLKEDDIPRGLDLQASPDEEFTIDKMRSNLERFYSTVVIGLLRCLTEIRRIRQWEEGGIRTIVTLLVYSIAWHFEVILSTFVLFLGSLILSPTTRQFCFDPPSAYRTQARQTSQGMADSEARANGWADSMMGMMTTITTGGDGDGGQKAEEKFTEEVNGMIVEDMQRKEQSAGLEGKSDKEKAIELYARPTMRIIGGIADKWERIANSLNPTPPFALDPHRTRVFMYIIAPLLLVTTFVSERLVCRMTGLSFGLFMFAKPVIDGCLEELDRRYPHWFESLIVEHNILSEVPTNMQLVLRLLREAEHQRAPLPPPPLENHQNQQEDDAADSGSTHSSESKKSKVKNFLTNTETKMSNGLRAKLRHGWDKAGSVKEEGFAWMSGHKTPDYERLAQTAFDKLNIPHEKGPANAILRRLPSGSKENAPDTASRYYVNHTKHGPGHIIIHPPTIPSAPSGSFTPARIVFTTIRRVSAAKNVSIDASSEPKKGDLTISVNDIVSIKKEGMNWPRRALTSWILDTQGAGGTGMEIKIARRGRPSVPEGDEAVRIPALEETIKLKSIVRRDELFSRLLSIGEQKWELL